MIFIYCPECGEENKDNANYCMNCGEELNFDDQDENITEKNDDKGGALNFPETDVETDKDGMIKPSINKDKKTYDDISHLGENAIKDKLSYYFVKLILILLNVFLPPLGAILVLKSKRFSKIGKSLGVIWAVAIIGLFMFGPTGEIDVAEKAEEAREHKEAGNYSRAAENYETVLENWDEEQEYPFSKEEVEGELETINKEHMVEVNFEVTQGEGEITPSPGAHEFYKNEDIEIKAEPEENWGFEAWKIEGKEVDNAETKVEELSEDKIVKASFSSVEKIAEEETEPAPPSEKDIDDYVDYLIEDTMGHSTNTGYARLIDFWAEGHNDEKLVLRLQGDENLTSNLTRDGMLNNSQEVITQLYRERNDINDLEIQWYMVLIDQRGNEENTQVIRIEFDRANYNNVNWDNFLTSNLPSIADYYWAHPNYR